MTAPPAAGHGLPARVAASVSAHLDDHIERLGWDSGRLASYQRDRLRGLLGHAAEHSRFHARRLRGVDPAGFELADLPRLPVMTKSQMMASFNQIVTDRRLARSVVEAHLAASDEPRLLFGEYVCLVSGGSSGLRGIFVQALSEYTDFVASIVRRGLARLRLAVRPPLEGLVIGLVGAASPAHSSGFAAATATGPPVRMIAAPATLPLPEIVARLNAAQPPALLGYPSKLAELAREQREGHLRIGPSSVTATAELLSAEDRAVIEDAFGVPVINQFVSTEGLAGQSQPGEMVFDFASDMCLVELVDADNQPVPEGVTSAKVLVTNLHNLTQPLVRYELTDRFTARPGTPGTGHLRASVDGRADDIFRYGDVDIHPHVIRSILVTTPALREYQIRQTEHGIEAACVADPGIDDAALAARLKQALSLAGIARPQADVRLVDSIARDPRTGKARRFIPSKAKGSRLTGPTQ